MKIIKCSDSRLNPLFQELDAIRCLYYRTDRSIYWTSTVEAVKRMIFVTGWRKEYIWRLVENEFLSTILLNDE